MLIGQKIDFVHDEVQGETKQGEEENLVRIVYQNLVARFNSCALTLREAKRILAQSKYISTDTINKAKQNYKAIKYTEQGQV